MSFAQIWRAMFASSPQIRMQLLCSPTHGATSQNAVRARFSNFFPSSPSSSSLHPSKAFRLKSAIFANRSLFGLDHGQQTSNS